MKTVIILFLSCLSAFANDRDRFSRQYAFFDRHAEEIIQASLDTPGMLPSVALAQAALETGYGSSHLYRNGNNLYGIKYTKGHKGGKIWSSKEGYFRAYRSADQSIRDRFHLLSRFKRYERVAKTQNAFEQVQAIAAAGYAEARNYAQVIIGIIQAYNLTQYDDEMYEAMRIRDYSALQLALIDPITLQHSPIENPYIARSISPVVQRQRSTPVAVSTSKQSQYKTKLNEKIALMEKQKLGNMRIDQVKLNHNTIDNQHATNVLDTGVNHLVNAAITLRASGTSVLY